MSQTRFAAAGSKWKIAFIARTSRTWCAPGRWRFSRPWNGWSEAKKSCGYRILSGSDAELLNVAAVIAYTHHEKFDGTGYPRGLKGQAIPIEGRIASIADAFDALTTQRVYKPAFELSHAIELMVKHRGDH